MGQIYDFPQNQDRSAFIDFVKNKLDGGMSFYEISNLFGVSEQAIKYHWHRYHLKTGRFSKKSPVKPRKRPADVYRDYLVELAKAGIQ
jgi:transposase